jgi:catechol 2,3-dioxygenase-like lactoylglutathione lyase family enzyme
MPSLENLKKQAKLYLRWHREGYYPVAARVRSVLPRFRELSDRDILRHAFKLADAQELVAREAGFESWQALKTGISSMQQPASPMPSRPVLKIAAPQLFVADIMSACDYFVHKLGFSIVFTYGEPPFYAHVKRDSALLILHCVAGAVFNGDIRERESLLAAEIAVDTAEEIKALYLEYEAAGVVFTQALKRQPWGAKNFIVRDPDGNLLLFAGPAE